MSLPPLRLGNSFDSYISGEVIIHQSAVIAPGVILQAAPNSKIVIGAGVCIGMGSILHVHEGTLEVEAGANLGAGFLMVGVGKIGENACIGAATTVFNCSVDAGQVIPPGSILGSPTPEHKEKDTQTRKQANAENKYYVSPTAPNPKGDPLPPQPPTSEETPSPHSPQPQRKPLAPTPLSGFRPSAPLPASPSIPNLNPTPENSLVQEGNENLNGTQKGALVAQSQDESVGNFGSVIYGQNSIKRLVGTLFPHRQSLSKPLSDDGQSE
ncbi:transferase [Iningainema tapete]|uniref:Transferase n=1 Tax=Iningainema tapete BLCC-T55 TaxID=2748662 RepID=A0A8J7CFX1_9CYAN|nr:transferase [Iningainema tapete]MBD2775530.1 transferase [Iningainema tapete BLCC-T55]